jgi:predicted secreted protein
MTDFTYDNYRTERETHDETIAFNNVLYANSASDGDYKLILKHVPGKGTGEQPCDVTEGSMIELTLENKWSDGKFTSQILQKDTELPKRRWCPYYYRVERIYFYEDKIAVFLNYFNQGFEGRSMRYMVVTAQMVELPQTLN